MRYIPKMNNLLNLPNHIDSSIKKSILEIKKLRRREYRQKTGLTIAEGYMEVTRAVKAQVFIKKLFICPEIIQPQQINEFEGLNIIQVSKEIFSYMAFGDRLKGILAICQPKQIQFSDLQIKENSLIVVLEGIEKPGNLGTIIRSCDGAGVDAIINCDGRTDVYNHNVVRASIGTVFHIPTVAANTADTIEYLKDNNFKIYAATAKSDQNYFDTHYSGKSAIVIGTEHDGLSDAWYQSADQTIKIPMLGESNCLNAAMSASILVYEALRQKKSI